MKILLSLILMFCLGICAQAQNNSQYQIIRSNIGSSGSSQTIETSRGTYKISQSIGQSSVIGTHYSNGYYLRQGYQQPSYNVKTIQHLDIKLKAKVYPNPFSQSLFINFSDVMLNEIFVKIFDVEARVIHTQIFLPAQELEVRLQDISNGTYFLKVASGNKQFNTKLIKI